MMTVRYSSQGKDEANSNAAVIRAYRDVSLQSNTALIICKELLFLFSRELLSFSGAPSPFQAIRPT